MKTSPQEYADHTITDKKSAVAVSYDALKSRHQKEVDALSPQVAAGKIAHHLFDRIRIGFAPLVKD